MGGDRRQNNGRNPAARSADAQCQRPMLVKPTVDEDGDRNHRAQTIADPGHCRPHTKKRVGLRRAVQPKGKPRTAHGKPGPHPQGHLSIVSSNQEHGHKGHQAAKGHQGGGLGMGQPPLRHDIGQVNGESIGYCPHGHKQEQGAGHTNHPAIVDFSHSHLPLLRRSRSPTPSGWLLLPP